MPASATVTSKPAPSPSRSHGGGPSSKAASGPGPAPALPSFARSALRTPPRPLAPLAGHGEGSASGAPLAPHVQEAVQSSLGVDLSTVRVHSDSGSQNKAESLSARAFTFGSNIFLGKGERPSDVALMAHEAAHVVQQQSSPAIHRWSSDRSDRYEQEADRASSAVQRGESFTVRERVSAPRVQRLGIKDALNYFADAANNIPGFRMFTIVLGVNPINMEQVDRSPANILRAAVEFLPGGKLITDALAKYGVFEKAGAWVREQLDTLAMVGAAIKHALSDFLDSLSWKDIFHLGSVWDRAVHIFTDPIDRILNFLLGLVEGIWTFVREAVLKPLAKLAEGTAGWDLLIAVLGRNPITGEAVPRTPDTLIGGFMKLVHQEEIWENIKRANAIPRAWAWFQGAITGLLGFVTQIPSLFIEALHSLSWSDILDLPGAFLRVARIFGKFLGNFISWAGDTIWTLLQIIFEVVAPGVMPYLKKLGASLKGILKNPIGFVKNLVAAGTLGFEQFTSKIGGYLKASFIEWLTGSLPGVYIPKALELQEIIKFVLSVLGLTWANIRGKLVKLLGDNTVKAMETSFDIVVTLVKEGPAAAWEKIKEEVGNLKDMVLQSIMDFVIETVVKKAVAKVVSLLVPGGAFIQAIISIYDTVMVFVNKLAKIIQVVKAFLDSLMDIAAGVIAAAANKVESTLAGLLTLAINFLAGFLGLNKIGEKVMDVINTKIRGPIDKALDKVIDWIVTMAGKLWKGAKGAAEGLLDWWKARQPFKATDGSSHTLLFVGEDENAELAFQSEQTVLKPFLVNATTPAEKKLAQEIEDEIQKISAIRTINKPGAPKLDKAARDKAKAEVAASMLTISVKLGQLVGSSQWGTEAQPLPIRYPKPAASSYTKLYFGPKTSARIPQQDLQAAYGGDAAALARIVKKLGKPEADAWQVKKYKVQEFEPAVSSPKALPEGGDKIGVLPDYQVKPQMKLLLNPGSTEGGGKINDALAGYGFNPTEEHMDGDHVVEMQLGGPNELKNLWPLNAGVNRGSGATIAGMQLPLPTGKTMPMEDVKKEAAKRKVWLVIEKTEG